MKRPPLNLIIKNMNQRVIGAIVNVTGNCTEDLILQSRISWRWEFSQLQLKTNGFNRIRDDIRSVNKRTIQFISH